MSKFLNLDELASPARTIKFKGVDHAVLELSFQHFVDLQKDLLGVQAAIDSGDNAKMLKFATTIIGRSVPTMSENVAELNDRQLLAVINMITNVYPDVSEEPDLPNAPAATDTAESPVAAQ